MSDSYDITLLVTNLKTGAVTNEKVRVSVPNNEQDGEYIRRVTQDLGERAANYFNTPSTLGL